MKKIGKTEFLLTELLESVMDGQPHLVVVALTHDHAAQLRDRAERMFNDAGLACVRRYGLSLDVEGAIVLSYVYDADVDLLVAAAKHYAETGKHMDIMTQSKTDDDIVDAPGPFDAHGGL